MGRAKQPPAIAYSYLRFSSPEQAKGDSVRRQTELRDAWLARSGAALDTTLSLRDEGTSAYTGTHRENPDRNALAAFLELVRRGSIPRGSYLIVESLDRLTREHIRPALTLLLNLIDQGVRVVQLLPVEQVFDDSAEPMTLMMAIMELSRGHSESRMKSERVGAAWRAKKARAAAAGEVLTRAVPGWLRVEGGGFVLDEPAAAAVREVFRLAIDGHGLTVITRRLNADKVPTIGRAGYWARSYVWKLLRTRAVVGEYQPHKGRGWKKRKPDGPPIPGYFPAVVSDDEWHAARGALTQRKGRAGRIGGRVNLFTGLAVDARDGGSVQVFNKGARSSGPVMVGYFALQGREGSKNVSFPAGVFEAAVLSQLREIDPREVLPRMDDAGDRMLQLAGRRAELEGRITRIQAELTAGGEVRSAVAALRALEAESEAVAAEVARLRQEAATPLAEAWGEYRSLVDALDRAPDQADARTRLRAVLRRTVAELRCLFVARGRIRMAAVQVRFTGGRHRDYLIVHRPPYGNASAVRPAETWVRSFAGAAEAGELDLRKARHVARLEKALAAADVAEFG